MNIIKLTNYELVLLKQALLKAEVSPLTTISEADNIRDLHVTIDQQVDDNVGHAVVKIPASALKGLPSHAPVTRDEFED